MNEIGGILLLAGIPSVICAAAGVFHGRRSTASRGKLLLGAFLVSGITCWSAFAAGGGDMNFPVILPSWLVSTIGPFMGPRTFIYPPWWLSPWLPFALYLLSAYMVRRSLAHGSIVDKKPDPQLWLRLVAGVGVVLATSVPGLVLQRSWHALTLMHLPFIVMFLVGIAITFVLAFFQDKKVIRVGLVLAAIYFLCGVVVFSDLNHPPSGMN